MQKEIATLRDALNMMLLVHHDGIVAQEQFTLSHFVALLDNGFLTPIRPGWYFMNYPAHVESLTRWRRCYWSFVSLYVPRRWGEDYCLNAEASLQLLTFGDPPRDLTVLRRKPKTWRLELPFDYTLLIRGEKNFPDKVEYKRGIPAMELNEALARVPNTFFQKSRGIAHCAIRRVQDMESLVETLEAHGKRRRAEWIVRERSRLDAELQEERLLHQKERESASGLERARSAIE